MERVKPEPGGSNASLPATGSPQRAINEQPLRQFVFLAMILITAIIVGAGFLLPAETAAPVATPSGDQQNAQTTAPSGQAPPELVKQIDTLKAQITANPTDTTSLITLADIYATVATTSQDYFNQAEDLYNRAIQADPKNPVAYAHLGDLYYDAQSWPQAANNYNRALEIVPKDIDTRGKLAVCYISQDMYNQAIQELKQIIDQQPNSLQAHYALGFAYALNTPPDTQAAVEQWQIVVKLDPNSQEAQDALKQIAKYKK